MALSDKDIEKFSLLWREEYGEEISAERAYCEAIACLHLVQLAYRPMGSEDRTTLQKERGTLLTLFQKDSKKFSDNKLNNL
jgi:hypothetical protein